MAALISSNWPSARHFTEALQYPSVSFTNPYLRDTLPAVDKLGMPLVTSGQFAYVYKLNRPDGGSWAVRCFRSFLADRQQRYAAFDAHFRENFLDALPRFAYEPEGLLINGRRYPILVMEWLAAPTLDTYVGQVLDKPEVLLHLADEWVRLMAELREAGVAHGDLQHGNILLQNGGFRLVDLDGMYVPALKGWRACEVGHQHFQHPGRAEAWFHEGLDNFAALSIYLSLIALAERPSLWREHHDENLLFTKTDFQQPAASQLFGLLRELGDEHRRLADLLATACHRDAPAVPPLDELVAVKEETNLPAWMHAPEGTEIVTRTREAPRQPVPARPAPRPWYAGAENMPPAAMTYPPAPLAPASHHAQAINSGSVQTLFGASAQQLDPQEVWNNTLFYAGQGAKAVFSKIGAFWIIFLFSSIWIRLITGFWAMFGVDTLAAFFLTFMLGALGFLVYGFLCALELSNNAPALAGAGSGVAPGQPVFQQTAAPVAALPPAQPANIPWYRQNTATAPVPARPLPPGARRAPDWAISSRPQPPPSNRPATAVVARFPYFHQPDCPDIAMIAVTELALFDTAGNAQRAGYQPCASCGHTIPPAPQYAPSPVHPLFASGPPATPKKLVQPSPPVVANRDTGVYHRLDCEDAVIISQEDEVKFNSLQTAEIAGFHRCQTCKPTAKNMPSAPQPVIGNQETRIYHLSDCEWAAGLKRTQIIKFNSASDAEAKGFHRCVTCRPGLVVTLEAVVGDRENLVFHLPACDLLDGIEVRFQVNFATAEKAGQANYQPCFACHP